MGKYWEYISCYEIPRNYSFWSALGLLGATIHRKVMFLHGDIEIFAPLYVLLVGPQGNGKTTCCDFACGMFAKVCPDLEIGASTQSAEDIVTTMAKDTFIRCFTNSEGEQIEVRPYAFFINEFKDFIAYNPTRMLNFLTNMYDRKIFKASTVKRGSENIINPSLSILGCENPEQLIGFMKNNIVTGGFSRRIIIVYEPHYQEPKPFINIPAAARLAWSEVETRLQEVRKITGVFRWAESGRKFYEPWYREKHASMAKISNQVMRGYVSTKHIQLFKVCMLLDCCSDKPMFLMTDELLQHGLSFLDAIESNMPKLSLSSGRNVMVGPQQKILEMLETSDGWMTEKQLKRQIEQELTPMEIMSVFRHLEDTDQIVKRLFPVPNSEGKPVERWMILLPWKFDEQIKSGAIKITTR